MALLPDGKILVAGYNDGSALVFARFDENGQPAPTFGEAGIVTTLLPAAPAPLPVVPYYLCGYYEGPALAPLPDGSVYVGAAAVVGLNEQMYAFKLLPDGKIDTGFGDAGQILLPQRPGSFAAYEMGIQPDGKIVLAGRGFTPTGGTDFAFMRFAP